MSGLVGGLVPLVMIPRYTTYVGANDFITAPMDVTPFARAVLTFMRGDLEGGGMLGATFTATFEESHDTNTWTPIGSNITSVNVTTKVTLDLTKRWMRLKIVLTDVTYGGEPPQVAITCWAVGSLVKRVP